ncbi:hypothetical protein Tco_0453002 [Tanacetum coccineum]
MLVAQVQEARIALSKGQIAILADTRDKVDSGTCAYSLTTNPIFQSDGIDLYDSDCDEVPNAQAAVQDTNLSVQQDSMILFLIEQMFEQMVNHVTSCDKANQETKSKSLIAELERYKERVKTFEQRHNIDLSSREKLIDSQMEDMIRDRLALKQEIDSLKQTLSNQTKEKESLLQTFNVFKNESKESKYMDKEIDLEKKIKELDIIVYKLGQSAKMVHMLTKPQVFYDDTHKQALGYQNSFYLKKAQRIKPTLYDDSVISRKHDVIYVTDEEETLILEEESRSKMLAKQNAPILIKQKTNFSPINYSELNKLSENFGKLPSELPKVSLVNTSLKKLKYHLSSFDTVVKKKITPDAITEGSWDILNEIIEVKMVFNQMEDAVAQYVMNIVMHADVKSDNVLCVQNTFLDAVINDYQSIEITYIEEYERNLKLVAELSQMKELSITCSRLERRESMNKPKVISLVGYKLDLEPVSSMLKNNREAHVDYIKITKANADTLYDIVEQARTSNPLDNALAYACMYTKQIQELLVYVSDTCPSSPLKSKNLVAITLMNKARKVTFTKISATSENNTQTRAYIHKTQTTNKPLVRSTSVKSSTNASESIPGRLGLHQLTLGYISSGLVQNPISPTSYVSPSKKDYEILFQPLFDEYFNPLPHDVSPDSVAVAALRAVDLAGSPSSTTIDQDVPSASTSPINQEIQSQVIHQGVEEQIYGHQNAQFDNAPVLYSLSSDPSSEEITLQGAIPSNLHHLNQSFDTLTKLIKNHPLENVIGNYRNP